VDAPSGLKLWDVFPPPFDLTDIQQVTPRGDTRQVLAQFEAYLKANWPSAPETEIGRGAPPPSPLGQGREGHDLRDYKPLGDLR